jgi:hypothetical protein
MSEVDPDHLAALRRLWIAFGFVEVLEIIDHQPAQAGVNDQGEVSR